LRSMANTAIVDNERNRLLGRIIGIRRDIRNVALALRELLSTR
jgi:hypothetical protein